MTRAKCEHAIAQKMREIWDIYTQYAPENSGYLIVTRTNLAISGNNAYWPDGKDVEHPINFQEWIAEEEDNDQRTGD